MSNSYEISIISSIFKSDLFVASFFADITRQSAFSRSELILISPGLSDYERSVLEIYQSKHNNISLVMVDPDPGLYGCWNVGLENSTAPYITNANLDDRRHPYSLERHVTELKSNPDIDLVYSPCLITTQPNESVEVNSAKQLYPCYEFDGMKGLLKHNSPHCAPMWRRSLHDKYGRFNEGYTSAGDHEMWLRAVSLGSAFKMVAEPLCLYYFNPRGLSTSVEKNAKKIEEEREVRDTYKL